jgi:hypothetical protein
MTVSACDKRFCHHPVAFFKIPDFFSDLNDIPTKFMTDDNRQPIAHNIRGSLSRTIGSGTSAVSSPGSGLFFTTANMFTTTLMEK